jgi:alkylated DNA repair protein (DNA oxidative demethylase)
VAGQLPLAFGDLRPPATEFLPGAWHLPRYAAGQAKALLAAIDLVNQHAPFRSMMTPGRRWMSVALTNCGALGWVTDQRGYRYQATDPESGRPWPPLPDGLLALAQGAASVAGYPGFVPDACLINRYLPGAKMALHQDRDERSYDHPIVSVSLGLPATFLFGGLERADRPERILLEHGDVVVFGGPARLRFHGILPVADGEHPEVGRQRLNLTLRKAG